MAETTADVRRDIELTRERMSTTLSQLEQKMNLMQIVRDHPWPALAVALGAGVVLSGSRADVKAAAATVTATRGASGRIGDVLDDLVSHVVAGVSGAFMNPRVSRDGRRIIVQRVTTQGSDAWLYDLDNGTERRVTTIGTVLGPAWDADERGIVYISSQDGRDALWATKVDGDGAAHRIVASSGAFAASPSHDADVLLFQRRVDGPWSIWRADIAAGSAHPVLQAAHDAFMPTLSPDGKWLAWAASESGKYEVYLRPFPGPGATVQVSVDGGTEPAWAPDGHTIFYRADRRMMAATISATEPRAVTRRRQLFTDTFDGDMPMPHRNYDVMPDGRRFVMIAPTQSRAPETIVVLNWLAEFQNKVAAAPH